LGYAEPVKLKGDAPAGKWRKAAVNRQSAMNLRGAPYGLSRQPVS
jgi:hypothetical protein